MANRRLCLVLAACVPLWAVCGCGRSNGANDYASRLTAEAERRTVPPGATGLLAFHSDTAGCAIRTQWTFASSWDSERYAAWLRVQLSPDFTAVLHSPYQMTFSRHQEGDAHSLVIETPPMRDSLHVRITLCVYPD